MISTALADILNQFSDAVHQRLGCGDPYFLGGQAHQIMMVELAEAAKDPEQLSQFEKEVGARMEELGLSTYPRPRGFEMIS
jgi:hypothetical protein